MPARASWKGQIRLALVSIPVEIYPATKSGSAIRFRQIHEPSGKPVRYEKVVPGIGPVDREEILKGFEVSKGNYVLFDKDEIEAVKIESRKTLELVQFVDAREIDVLYYEKPYFVVPADELAEEAYIVLREALRQSRKVGLGQLAMRGREHLVSLKPCGRGLVLELLRYSDEVDRAASYFREIEDSEVPAELLELATTLIDKKTAAFAPEQFHDRYVEALHELIEEKSKTPGHQVEAVEANEGGPRGGNVIDLMAALKRSIGGEGASSSKKVSPKRRAGERRGAWLLR